MSYVKLSLKKKLFFSFIILVFLLLALELFSYITLNLMCLPMPSRLFGETSYMTPDRDIGWALAPGVSHHILKYPQGYDITIRTGNSYRKDAQNIRRVKDCDVITIGDSHTFGFGLKDEQTLAFQLHSLLSHDQHKCLVFNGGVPGLGPCQYYLRLRSLGRLAAGSLVIVYFNPLNDLRGLSRDVDYGNTKPYVCLEGTLIRYVRPILYNAKTPYHFSRDFDSLNQAFNTSPPSVPSEGTHLLQNSQTWQLVSDLRQKRIRPRWKQLEPTEAIDTYQDGWEHEYNRQRSFQRQALQRAGGLWPEIAEFESERRIAEEILHRIFSDMKKHVENQRAHLIVVIAEEPHAKQGFCVRLRDILIEQFPQYTFQDGRSRQVVKRAAQRAEVSYLMIDYPGDRMESMFIPYDGHTSAEGFSWTAQEIAKWMEERQFAFLDGKRQVKAAVQEDPNIDKLDGNGYALLHYAVQNGKHQAVERLIVEGADINSKDRWGETPLYIATSRGHKSILEMLLDKGADINVADHRGQTPLHQAIQSGQDEVTELLIAEGADINLKNNDGLTPFEIALIRNHKKIVELLRSKGAVMDISSIHVAAQVGDLAKVNAFLEDGNDINAGDDRGFTPLHYAVQGGHKEVAEFLIAKGADINSKDKNGYTPFHYALGYSKTDIARLLIEKGADIYTKDQSGYTPLHWAVMMGNRELTELVLSKGADVNVKGKAGETPLDFAIYGGKAIGQLLVEKGAEVSSLQSAAFIGDLDNVKAFLDGGVDVNAKNATGVTALHAAANEGRKEVAELLLAKGADINISVRNGQTPLHWSARGGSKEVVELLISKGSDVNAADKNRVTALHIAAEEGNRDMAALLIGKGADMNAKDKWVWTPLHYACWKNRKETVEFLLAKGVGLNTREEKGKTPLAVAKKEGHNEIVSLLRKHGAKE